jgi:Protein of unknown function (DUF1580)
MIQFIHVWSFFMSASTHYWPLVKAVEEATGRRPHLCTVLRWTRTGSKGIILKSVLIGGRRCCTVEAVNEFIEATTKAASRLPTPAQPTKSQLENAKKRADAILDRAGV